MSVVCSRAVALALLAWTAGCALPVVVTPVDRAASEAFSEAWRLSRVDGPEEESAARLALEAAERAAALAPDWVAPRRFLDNRLREDLLAPVAFATYRALLEERPDDARLLYLAGRLEGDAGGARFARAARADPSLSWAAHGMAWDAFGRDRFRKAVQHGERAVDLARDPYERAFFTLSLARYLRAARRNDEASEFLSERLADPGLTAEQRAWLAVELARTEMDSEESEVRETGFRRALSLLVEEQPTSDEIQALVRTAHLVVQADPSLGSSDQIVLALARGNRDKGNPTRDRLRGELMLREHRTPLAFELYLGGLGGEGRTSSARELLVFQCALGEPDDAVAAWLAELPGQVLGDDGLPREERLAALVRAARALSPTWRADVDPEAMSAFGDALVAAGWFREARALAQRLPARDLELAQELDSRALAGEAALEGIAGLVYRVDEGRARIEPSISSLRATGSDEVASREVDSLDDLLVAIAPHLARANVFLGGETDASRVADALLTAPRVSYGWFGSVVHPGPSLSAQDEALSRGKAGKRVGGLAHELERMGRFGLFGRVLGGGPPDGTILRALFVEQRSGEHLGRPWAGTIAWCEGVDLPGRAARRGVSIGGAALHEGYWIDIEAVRGEWESWEALRSRFASDPERIARALAAPAPPLAEDTAAERARSDVLLGQADRLRLAVLTERAENGEVLGAVSLDELVEVTSIHEEGHLCDRAQLYPISAHLFEVLAFVARAGFSAEGVSKSLEYRAQLVAFCAAPDPRLPLVDILAGAEVGGNGVTPHASAYSVLLDDLLAEIAEELEDDPAAWPELDSERRIAHQLHRVAPEKLRAIAVRLARREGLVAD